MQDLEMALQTLRIQRSKIARLGANLYVPKSSQRIHNLALNSTTQVARKDCCEKCGKTTHFVVTVLDRTAYWCGCN